MLYPAKLRIIARGETFFFDSSRVAASWLDKNEQHMSSIISTTSSCDVQGNGIVWRGGRGEHSLKKRLGCDRVVIGKCEWEKCCFCPISSPLFFFVTLLVLISFPLLPPFLPYPSPFLPFFFFLSSPPQTFSYFFFTIVAKGGFLCCARVLSV